MTIPPAKVEHCLKALGLVYNRLGGPTQQDDDDFDLMLANETRIELVDLLMTVAGMVSVIIEDVGSLYDALDGADILDEDPLTQARAVLDSMRDMFIDQGINETTA